MNLGLDEREAELLERALLVFPVQGEECDLRADLLATLRNLPRFRAEAHAFALRIDALKVEPEALVVLAGDPPTPTERLLADLDAWKLPRHLEHEVVYYRTIVEFPR
jgi:hypothetical protein